MNRTSIILKLTACISTLLVTHYANAMRCDNNVIEKGAHQHEVLELCGAPATTTDVPLFRTYRLSMAEVARRGFPDNYTVVNGEVEVSEKIDRQEWIYNFGSKRLQRKVTFENGIVTRIKSLKYGY